MNAAVSPAGTPTISSARSSNEAPIERAWAWVSPSAGGALKRTMAGSDARNLPGRGMHLYRRPPAGLCSRRRHNRVVSSPARRHETTLASACPRQSCSRHCHRGSSHCSPRPGSSRHDVVRHRYADSWSPSSAWPAASRATAVSVWSPLRCRRRVPRQLVGCRRVFGAQRRAVEQELHAHDADVVRTPSPPPSPCRLTLLAASGLVSATVGAVVSFVTVTLTLAAVVCWPAASRATAVDVCSAVGHGRVSHANS